MVRTVGTSLAGRAVATCAARGRIPFGGGALRCQDCSWVSGCGLVKRPTVLMTRAERSPTLREALDNGEGTGGFRPAVNG